MTYNTCHGGTCQKFPNQTQNQINAIAAEHADVVILQEASNTEFLTYKNGLTTATGVGWDGAFRQHCPTGNWVTGPPAHCTSFGNESIMILAKTSVLQSTLSEGTNFFAADNFWSARASVKVLLKLSNGVQVAVFGGHLPVDCNVGLCGFTKSYDMQRVQYVDQLKTWMESYTGPKFFGGDMNAHPQTNAYNEMHQDKPPPTGNAPGAYEDIWINLLHPGVGDGFTHANPTVSDRIDYLWVDTAGQGSAASAPYVPNDVTQSDHRPVVAVYTFQAGPPPNPTPPGETPLLDDQFMTLDTTTKWTKSVFSGTVDPNVTVTVNTDSSQPYYQQLKITPVCCLTNSHYNAVTSKATQNFTNNGYAQVQLIQAPAAVADTWAMFTVGSSSQNLYRWFVGWNSSTSQQYIAYTIKLNDVKADHYVAPYDPSTHKFFRIRHDSTNSANDVVFETSADNTIWFPQDREGWNSLIDVTKLWLELKGGTGTTAVTSPGVVVWDNFHAAINFSGAASTTFLTEPFNASTSNPGDANWSTTLVTPGQNTSIGVVWDGTLNIGPLFGGSTAQTGSWYNGLVSVNPATFDLTNAYASVEVADIPATNTFAEMHLTVLSDSNNFYRAYLKGDGAGHMILYFQKKVAGIKTPITNITLNTDLTTGYPFVRVRHDPTANNNVGGIVIEIAQNVNGAPGGWCIPEVVASPPLACNATNSAFVASVDFAITQMRLELKAGTDRSESNPPGNVAFDNVLVAK